MWLLSPVWAAIVPASQVEFEVVVSGSIAEITVRQSFRNDGDAFVDGEYRFPLHERAVVDGMAIRLDDRTIDGIVLEKEEARAVYEAAVAQGQTAALTETERWNLYRQQVGNIPPHATLDVELRIVQPVDRVGRDFELVVPIDQPGSFSDEPSSSRADVGVEIAVGLPIHAVDCVSHRSFAAPTGEGWTVLVEDADPALGPVVVRWSLVDTSFQVGGVYDGRHVLLLLEPPDVGPPPEPIERVLISGFAGHQIQDQRLRQQLAQQLANQGDTVVQIDATDRAEALLEQLEREGHRHVIYVGDGRFDGEALLEAAAAYEGTTRLSVVAMSPRANRFLLDALASRLGGQVFTPPHTPERLAELLQRPVLRAVRIDWGDWGEADLAAGLQDVHLGKPATVLARTTWTHGGPVFVEGLLAGEPVRFRIEPEPVAQGRALGSTWARARIEDLGGRQVRTGISAREQGLPLALEYQVLSPWTAFVAVDPRVREPVAPLVSDDTSVLAEDRPTTGKRMESFHYDVPAGRSYEQRVSLPASVGTTPVPERRARRPVLPSRMAAKEQSESTVEEVVLYRRTPATSVTGAVPMLPRGASGGALRIVGPARLDASVDRATGDRSWLQIPVSLRAVDEGVDVGAELEFQRLDAPVVDAWDRRRIGLAAWASVDGDDAGLQLGTQVHRLGCTRCDAVWSGNISLGLERRVTRSHWSAYAGGAGSLGALAGRWGAAVGPRAGLDWQQGIGLLHVAGGLHGVFDGRTRLVPEVAVWAGPGGGGELTAHLVVGAEQRVDASLSAWGVPVARRAWGGVRLADEGPLELWLRAGLERRTGPLSTPFELAQSASTTTWTRDGALLELLARYSLREQVLFDATVVGTRVLRSDVGLDQPTVPYLVGVLSSHRPFRADVGMRWVPGDSFGFNAHLGVDSPLPGTGWWTRWQLRGSLGVSVFPVEELGFSVAAEAWSGRPGDPDPSRLDGWISPERAGMFALRAGLILRY